MKHLVSSLAVVCSLAGSAAAEAVPGEYIVVMRGPAPTTMTAQARVDVGREIDQLARLHDVQIERRYDTALSGFVAKMTPAQAGAIAGDPNVALVEENQIVRADAIQAMPAWGLDRIDQGPLPLDSRYVQLGDGEGATVYVIDTGVRTTHAELTGRVLPGAFTIMDGREVTDCNGHGTHVTATIAGTLYGVAKRAQIVPVRVLGCDGSGTTADVIAGIDWVTANRRPKAVANMSIGAPASDAEDLAVRNLIAAGVTVVVAAGNENQNACLRSPARVADAITVGATTTTDARAGFSNWGPCVDVSAPGVAIVSAGIATDTATNQLDGTSMASPHVAGIAAAYIAANAGATPAQVAAAIVGGATRDKIVDAKGSPNLIASSRIVDSTPPTATITYPGPDAVVDASFSVLVDAADANLAGVAVAVDGMQIGAQAAGPFAFPVDGLAEGLHTITVTTADLAGLTTIRNLNVTVRSAPESGELSSGCSAGGEAGLAIVLALGMLVARRRRAWLGLAAAGAIVACTVGEESPDGPRYVDSDGDGVSDGIDTDGDGVPDYRFSGCATCAPGAVPVCLNPLVDTNSDGLPDGLDLDCDGAIDIPLGGTGGGGGSQQRCQSTIDDRSIDCTRTNGGPAQCECRIDDQLVKSCTTTSTSPCTFGGTSNCCGF